MKRLFDLSQASTAKLVVIVLALYAAIAVVTFVVWSN
jgi:hypothetical protein